MTREHMEEDLIAKEDQEEPSLADDIERLKSEDAEQEGGEENNTEPDKEKPEPDEPEESEEEKAERERLKEAQRKYKERQEEKLRRSQEERQQQHVEKAKSAISDADKEALDYVKKLHQQQVFEQNIKAGEAQLTQLEGDFREAYPDYDDKVSQAMDLTKIRLVEQGATEAEAEQMLKREKVLLADRAAAQRKDPVEAIYNEANQILSVFEKFAQKNGYEKPQKKKTNLQALREASKPNAMSAGAGKGAQAARKTLNDMDSEELDELTMGDLLKMKK